MHTYDYAIEQEMDAGIGIDRSPEVKSVRDGKASISEAYCFLTESGIKIKGMHIAEFKNAGYVEQQPTRGACISC